MKIHPGLTRLVCVSLAAMLLASCGSSGPELGAVTGTVTLDGQPLPDAKVEFEPEAKGNPSVGITDSAGKYRLMYTHDKPGATPGKHRVRIVSNTYAVDAAGNESEIPQRVPAKYNTQSELTAEVTGSSKTIDFPLTSQ